MKTGTLILLLLLSQAVRAIDINIIRGYEKPVCRAAQTMLHGVASRSQLHDLQWKSPGYYHDSKITLPKWKQGTIYVIKNRSYPIHYAHIDINNDGKDEVVFL